MAPVAQVVVPPPQHQTHSQLHYLIFLFFMSLLASRTSGLSTALCVIATLESPCVRTGVMHSLNKYARRYEVFRYLLAFDLPISCPPLAVHINCTIDIYVHNFTVLNINDPQVHMYLPRTDFFLVHISDAILLLSRQPPRVCAPRRAVAVPGPWLLGAACADPLLAAGAPVCPHAFSRPSAPIVIGKIKSYLFLKNIVI